MMTAIGVNRMMAGVLIALAAIWDGMQRWVRQVGLSSRTRHACSKFWLRLAQQRPPAKGTVILDSESLIACAADLAFEPTSGGILGPRGENKASCLSAWRNPLDPR